MFHTYIRRHNDEVLHTWVRSLISDLRNKGGIFSAHYLGYGQFTLQHNIKFFNRNNTAIAFCFDYTYPHNRKHIIDQLEDNKDARLIWIGAEKDVFDHPRITNIFCPGDMIIDLHVYQKFNDVEKDPSNEKHWISTSLNPRPHRILMASLLKGLGLDKHGDLRIDTQNVFIKKKGSFGDRKFVKPYSVLPTLPLFMKDQCKLSKEIENISPESSKGYEELIQKKHWGSSIFRHSDYQALGKNQNNNALNFDKNLRHLYKDKTLEVVNETLHGYEPIFVTEKVMNAVIGLNLIVMNGPAGTVKLLEDMGWNSCRHVVNHDYDDIADPIMRSEQSIRLNLKLFSDPKHCNKVWKDCLPILRENSEWARDRLQKQILRKCEEQVKKIAQTVGLSKTN